MSLTVETGTGLSTAEAYVSVADWKTYCSNRNYRWEEYEDSQIEAALRLGAQWIDTFYRYKGTRLTTTQSLEFPRAGCTDWSGIDVSGVPLRVAHACTELAFKSLSEPLYEDAARGGMTVSESVGPISVTYSADAPPSKLFVAAANLLKPFVRDPEQILGPKWAEPATGPQFTIGMSDYPGFSVDYTE